MSELNHLRLFRMYEEPFGLKRKIFLLIKF